MDTPLMEIQTFSSPEEIWLLPNFVENNPINQINYKRLIGDYHFGEEVRCCYEKETGSLCKEPHKRGWVAMLLDGSATIIGNHCAEIRFGADSRLIADQSKYNNEKRRRERLSAILLQLSEKAMRLEQLDLLCGQLKELTERVKSFTQEIGPLTLRRLHDMGRTGQSVVTITAVRFRDYVDDEGQTKRERSHFSQTLGSLHGLDLLRSSLFATVYVVIEDIKQAYEEAERLGEKTKSATVDALASRLNEYDRIVKEGNRLLRLEQSFLSNRFLLLCFVQADKAERYKCAGFAMRLSGANGGKEKAKAWLAEQEKAIKQQLGVDAIEIR